MYERFTDGARKILFEAQQQARQRHHEYVAAEHLLLAMCHLHDAQVTKLLQPLIDLHVLYTLISNKLFSGLDSVEDTAKLPLTPSAKKVIEHAIKEAQELEHDYIGSEHLLLGVLALPENLTALIFASQGITATEIRQELIKNTPVVAQENKPTLIVLVGLPRSGKTTWARQQNLPIVCPDAIRLAIHGQRYLAEAEPWVWLFAKTMVPALFLAGHTKVIVDATHTTRKRRDEWRSDKWQTYYKVMATAAAVCRDRAKNDPELLTAIDRMATQYEAPAPDEPVYTGWQATITTSR